MKKNKIAGITLIEVMVAAAIIAILAAIAIPSYQNQTRKAGRTDGRTALAAIALAQERFFTVNGSYALGTAGSPFTALDLPGDLTATATAITSAQGFYSIAMNPAATATTFTLRATPVAGRRQAGDTECTAMTMTHLGVKDGLPANNRCW